MTAPHDDTLLERRRRLLGASYRLFYDEPFHPVRGLFDRHGARWRLRSRDGQRPARLTGKSAACYSARHLPSQLEEPEMPNDAPVVMVSGANRGIGAAIAETLHAAGWRVSLGCRTEPAERPERNDWLVCHYDALDSQSARSWIEETVRVFGGIDALVNNAGILSRASVLEADSDEFDRVMAVNAKAPMLLTQQAWPHLVAAEQGKVVSIVSLSGKRVRSAGSGLYAMSKFAAQAFVHGLRHCSAETRVRATAICPGFVATDMAAGADIDAEEVTQPEDVARTVRLLLELPPSASIAEVPVNWRIEDTV